MKISGNFRFPGWICRALRDRQAPSQGHKPKGWQNFPACGLLQRPARFVNMLSGAKARRRALAAGAFADAAGDALPARGFAVFRLLVRGDGEVDQGFFVLLPVQQHQPE